jgi:hypothetical protein
MDEIRLWKIIESNSQELNVERIQNLKETEGNGVKSTFDPCC